TCRTVDEAFEFFRSHPRTTAVGLVACDPTTSAVFELSPDAVARQDPDCGVSVCTNHFVSPRLANRVQPDTYATLGRHRHLCRVAAGGGRFGVAELFAVLHAVNRGPQTIQTMVFDPADLILHLAAGPGPSSALPPTAIRLTDWF